jgi:outer membrane protein OmpA-like peptidoglycan-associated protein
VRKLGRLCGPSGLALGLTVALAGCSLSAFDSPVTAPSVGAGVVITQPSVPSALVAVVDGSGSGGALAALVKATARPREDLAVLQAGTRPQTVVSAESPAPPTLRVAGKPIAPHEDETSYLAAQYADRVDRWRRQVAAARYEEMTRTAVALSAWLRSLRLVTRVGKPADSAGTVGSIAGESAAAASALTGLEQNGNVFGSRRVILLYTGDLSGRPAIGELAGDTVLVVTPYLATAASASAAQAALLAAGAAAAAVVGPEVTGTQIAALVSAGLSQGGAHESVSAPVLFGNDSAALTRRAAAQLTSLLPQLHRPGVTAVVNGFASVPGTASRNYLLSYERATSVASFLESRGVPASSLVIVGHGASDLISGGKSGQNRRVTVVIEKP